jgi:hypothetical protein
MYIDDFTIDGIVARIDWLEAETNRAHIAGEWKEDSIDDRQGWHLKIGAPGDDGSVLYLSVDQNDDGWSWAVSNMALDDDPTISGWSPDPDGAKTACVGAARPLLLAALARVLGLLGRQTEDYHLTVGATPPGAP